MLPGHYHKINSFWLNRDPTLTLQVYFALMTNWLYLYHKHLTVIFLLSIDLFPGYGALQYAVCAPHGGLWHILYGSTHSAAHLCCLLEVSSTKNPSLTHSQQHKTDLQRSVFECSFQVLLSSADNRKWLCYFCSFPLVYFPVLCSHRYTYTLKDSFFRL